MTFMTWPQRGPGSTQPAPSASSVSTPAALPAALPLQEAVGALGVRMLLYASLSQGQQQLQPHQAGAAATALPSGRSGSSSSSSGAPAAGPGVAASISPFLQPAVCVLRVLDVSDCGGLSLGAAPAAKLFQAAVGAMPHLEGEPAGGGGRTGVGRRDGLWDGWMCRGGVVRDWALNWVGAPVLGCSRSLVQHGSGHGGGQCCWAWEGVAGGNCAPEHVVHAVTVIRNAVQTCNAIDQHTVRTLL
jgi:hypothetical protein